MRERSFLIGFTPLYRWYTLPQRRFLHLERQQVKTILS